MEKINNMGSRSLEALARNNISEENKRNLTVDISTSIAGLCCLAAGLIFNAIFPDRPAVTDLIYTLGFIIECIPVYIDAINGVMSRNFTNAMEILVAIAVTACYFSDELITALLIPTILNLSHLLEERSIMGGREAIEGLKHLQSKTASLINEDGSLSPVSSVNLEPDQLIQILPGDGIPADGEVIEGESNIDQKSLTGEPEPCFVSSGSKVYAGTFNLDGKLKVRVTKKYSDTSFSGILRMLEESENMAIPESRLVDRFMKYYIPLVLSIAAAVALIEKDLSRAIAILVVSCPCGQMLVTSAPVVAALSSATKRGILIKNSKFIENLSSADTVVFDKTGTLTEGEMNVSEILCADDISESELLNVAASLSAGSSHHIASAIMKYVGDGFPVMKLETHEIPGKGMYSISSDGTALRFGRRGWIEEEASLKIPDSFTEKLSGTVSFVSSGNRLLGAVIFGDTIRQDANEAVNLLRNMGIEKTVILTGDRESAALDIKEKAGIDLVYSSLLPEDKLKLLIELREEGTVIAVGDGINDAPTLREAHVGIAMGAMGSDLAIQSADVALMNNNLTNIPYALSLAAKTRRIIYENLAISMTVSGIMIILSAFGIITAIVGAMVHNIGAFAVILNSSRILRHEMK